MPLFQISKDAVATVEQTNFSVEKDLQTLVERNLDAVFKCRFVASEFPTGARHGGRIDTLALSEDGNPVIIEYKKVESSELINQSLFYLSWIHDHRGDFEIAVQKELGASVEVDWSDIRVICIAPNYKKYDLHAAQVMGANLELWAYRLFKNGYLYLEEVLQKSYSPASGHAEKALTAGQKAALTRRTGTYSYEEHIEGKPEAMVEIANAVQEFMLGLDPSMEEVPKKFYVTYRMSQNIVCMEVQRQRVLLYLKLDPSEVDAPADITRDVTEIGHYGTGDLEASVRKPEDLERMKLLMVRAYERVGG